MNFAVWTDWVARGIVKLSSIQVFVSQCKRMSKNQLSIKLGLIHSLKQTHSVRLLVREIKEHFLTPINQKIPKIIDQLCKICQVRYFDFSIALQFLN